MPEQTQKPVRVKELERRFKARAARKDSPIAVERRFHVAADREPRISTRLERIDRGDGKPSWEVIVDIDGIRAGGRALPPRMKGKATKVGKRKVSEESLAQQLTGFIPDHLGFSAMPRSGQKRRSIRPRCAPPSRDTVFGTDERARSRTRTTHGRPSVWCRPTVARAPA
jgi:hypothetical protein